MAETEYVAAFLEQSDHLEPFATDEHELTDRVGRHLKVVAHLCADDDHTASATVVAGRQEPPLEGRHPERRLCVFGAAEDLWRGVAGLPADGAELRAEDRRHVLHTRDPIAQHLDVLEGQGIDSTGAEILLLVDRLEGERVAAEVGELVADRVGETLQYRHDGDHRHGADEDAERRQEAAQAMGIEAR